MAYQRQAGKIVFNICCVIAIAFLLIVSTCIFTTVHASTMLVRDFSIEEMEPEYDKFKTPLKGHYNTYQITNKSDSDYKDVKLQLELLDAYSQLICYGYSATFNIKSGETLTIRTPTYAEMVNDDKKSDLIVYVKGETIVMNDTEGK